MLFVDLEDNVCRLITREVNHEVVVLLGVHDSHVTSAPMQLTRLQVDMILPYLQRFAATGTHI